MSDKNTAVFGIYATPGTAEAAVDQLLANGFTNAAISVLLPDDDSTRAFAHEKHTKAPEGTTTGVTAGGIIGGSLGLLAGIGALAIPGVGPLIAAGPIMASLAGLGVGGAVGGLVGALVGLGIPEYEAKRYEGAVKGGGTLLSVHCDTSEQVDIAKASLKQTGATDISSTGEAGSKDTAGGRGTFGNISDGEPIDTVVTDDATASSRH
jgi:tetrahydromethanopterin S-methyltransferase subunit C